MEGVFAKFEDHRFLRKAYGYSRTSWMKREKVTIVSGKEVELRDYFLSEGKISEDLQRESQHTRILADRIVERYFKENIVLSSHLVAFAAFELLKKANYKLDLFALLRLPTEDFYISLPDFEACIA